MDVSASKLLIDVDEAAALLNLKVPQLYALVRADIVPVVRIGRKVMFSPAVLRDWVAAGGSAFAGGWRRAAKESQEC